MIQIPESLYNEEITQDFIDYLGYAEKIITNRRSESEFESLVKEAKKNIFLASRERLRGIAGFEELFQDETEEE